MYKNSGTPGRKSNDDGTPFADRILVHPKLFHPRCTKNYGTPRFTKNYCAPGVPRIMVHLGVPKLKARHVSYVSLMIGGPRPK